MTLPSPQMCTLELFTLLGSVGRTGDTMPLSSSDSSACLTRYSLGLCTLDEVANHEI